MAPQKIAPNMEAYSPECLPLAWSPVSPTMSQPLQGKLPPTPSDSKIPRAVCSTYVGKMRDNAAAPASRVGTKMTHEVQNMSK